MKMKPAHQERLTRLVQRHYTPQLRQAYKDKGLSDKRFRWDMLWRVPQAERQSFFDAVYKYCNDEHIDSVLKMIVKDLDLSYSPVCRMNPSRSTTMRVAFKTKRGKRISFTAYSGTRKRKHRASRSPTGPLFRTGKMLPRRAGMRRGDIVHVRGHRGAYLVMKTGLKPVRA